MYKVVVGGCRYFSDYKILCETLDALLSNHKNDVTLLSGHCRGTDMLAERYAREHGLGLELYPAEWDKYGLSAGPRRNKIMVSEADAVVAFWDGVSRGTHSLIKFAKESSKPLRVIMIEKEKT